MTLSLLLCGRAAAAYNAWLGRENKKEEEEKGSVPGEAASRV